jgi:protein-cysteine N-palmitoyltransferase HHAT
MGPVEFLKSLYNPGTLDTRFMTPPTIPYKTYIEAASDPVQGKDYTATIKASATPSRWRTLEFKLYLLFVSFAVPYMFWVGFQVSRRA